MIFIFSRVILHLFNAIIALSMMESIYNKGNESRFGDTEKT